MDGITILFLAANPASTDKLMLDEEIRAITEKIYASEYRDHLKVESYWAIRPDDLLQSFNRYKPHIVHFSGHGGQDGEIILVDSNRSPKPVSTQALKALFTTLKDNIQIVILNACYSRSQAEAIIEVVNCAIGMNDSIGDEAAIIFAASFYRALGFGRSIQEAFDQGKVALQLEGILEVHTPELLVKAGVNPSQIVLVSQTPPPVPTPPTGLPGKETKRERLFNAYKVILNAADKYQFEMQQLNHMPSSMNISLTGVDEAVTEITLEDVGTDVLPIFFELRGAFHTYATKLDTHDSSWEEVSKHREAVFQKTEELTTAMKRHLKELES